MDINFLLALGSELTPVKTRKQLQKTVGGPVRSVLSFRYSTIFLFNESRTSAYDLFYDPEMESAENPFCEGTFVGRFSADQGHYNFDKADKNRQLEAYLKNGASLFKGDDPCYFKGCILNLYEIDRVLGHWVLLFPSGEPEQASLSFYESDQGLEGRDKRKLPAFDGDGF